MQLSSNYTIMKNMVTYTSQSRFDFDIDELLNSGFTAAYVTSFVKNNECFSDPELILSNLEKLWIKSLEAKRKGLDVYPLFITIGHPEGNYRMPQRYRIQRNIDGSKRLGSVCFLDEIRQDEVVLFAKRAAELGFGRIAFDDDLRDAFCYCDEHIYGFGEFMSKSRQEISEILNGVLSNPEHEQLREKWYDYKNCRMQNFARRIEHAVHDANPLCRIGIFNSAKRCHDFSGRSPLVWANLFHTEDAPVFIRLCGECYDDNIMRLVQSTGWHSYFGEVYPVEMEKMLELTSVPSISYRSPGKVLLECSAVCAVTGESNILWAWTEEFRHTDLNKLLSSFKDEVVSLLPRSKDKPISPLSVYIGHELGAYTPPNISESYGVKSDPLSIYNVSSLTGLPVIVRPEIDVHQPAVICSSYMSREMIEKVDDYVKFGGICLLDSIAAQSYLKYGGDVQFGVTGPVNSLRYEISFDAERDDMISDYPCDSTYIVTGVPDNTLWQVYDTNDKLVGVTIAVIESGKGRLVVMGYDISIAGAALLRPAWRQRIQKILLAAGVEMPVYWSGSPGVQVVLYSNRCAVINYNSNKVEGELVFERGIKKIIEIMPLSIVFVDRY